MKKPITQKTSAREATLATIRTLTGQANILTIPREFINYTGSLDCALFLSQLLYWSDKAGRSDGFIYKSYEDWKTEIHLSEYEVRKAANKLKGLGILETKLKKANGSPTLHYRLDFDKFSESFLNFLQEQKQTNCENQTVENEESLTKITTDTTIVNKRESADAPTHPKTRFFQPIEIAGEDDGVIDAEPVNNKKPISKKSQASPVPEDFWPGAGTLDWALNNYSETPIREATHKFIHHHRARGTKLKDWNAEWKKWITSEHPVKERDRWGNYSLRMYNVRKEHMDLYEKVSDAIRDAVEKLCETSPAVHLDEIHAALPDFSPQVLSDTLSYSCVAYNEIASPTQDFYCKKGYETDPHYRDEVDSWLEERGVEIGVFDDDGCISLREALETLSPVEKEKVIGLMYPPGFEFNDRNLDETFIPPDYVSDILSGRLKLPPYPFAS
jgi:hypothetical protein